VPLAAWRIVKTRHAATAWDGEGARVEGGRWNSPGVPVVYTPHSSAALAALEMLVERPESDPCERNTEADLPETEATPEVGGSGARDKHGAQLASMGLSDEGDCCHHGCITSGAPFGGALTSS
jgi:RES domain-containing protein